MGRGARKIGVSKAAGAEGAERWPESGPEAASYHEHETTLNHKTSHRP